jgi:hypothetical protein
MTLLRQLLIESLFSPEMRQRLPNGGWRKVSIATQVLGDVANCVRGDFLRGGIGVIIAGRLLLFLLRSNIRGRLCLESFSKKFEEDITA